MAIQVEIHNKKFIGNRSEKFHGRPPVFTALGSSNFPSYVLCYKELTL